MPEAFGGDGSNTVAETSGNPSRSFTLRIDIVPMSIVYTHILSYIFGLYYQFL